MVTVASAPAWSRLLTEPAMLASGTEASVRLASGTLIGCLHVEHVVARPANSSLTWYFIPHCRQANWIMATPHRSLFWSCFFHLLLKAAEGQASIAGVARLWSY